jgi:heat shock protein HtpX
MVMIPTHVGLTLSMQHAWDKLTGWVSGYAPPARYSVEETLLNTQRIDARFAPKAPMSSDEIDAKTLVDLSRAGMRRAKLVSPQSHPDLYAAFELMARRAGMPRAPQLILAQSAAPNAFTLPTQEVVVTTGLLNMCDYREVCAVLGHELGHATSDHFRPRMFWTALLGGGGALVGNELARKTSLVHSTIDALAELPMLEKPIRAWFPENRVIHGSVLGGLLSIMTFSTMGRVAANHLSVKPTELDADRKGAAISGDPAALASALLKIQARLDQHGSRGKLATTMSGYPTTQARIDQLRSLPQQRPVAETATPSPRVAQGLANEGRLGAAVSLGID